MLRDRLADDGQAVHAIRVSDALTEGIYLDQLLPQSAYYWELTVQAQVTDPKIVKSPSIEAGAAFLGAPPVLRAQAGSELQLDLRRFGNPGATHRFAVKDGDGVMASIDHLNHRLNLTITAAASGLQMLPLSLEPLDMGSGVWPS